MLAQNVERKIRNFIGNKFWRADTLSPPLAGIKPPALLEVIGFSR
jgi:hypothetical protein